MDFSDGDVGGGLAALAAHQAVAVGRHDVPSDLSGLQLLHGLDQRQIAELVAAAANVGREVQDKSETRALDADLLAVVADRLDAPITFARLRAGIQVLRRVYDGRQGGPLSAEEEARLSAQIDIVGQTERVQNEVRFLASMSELLARIHRSGHGVR